MMLFDTHTHVNFSAFDADRDEVLKRCTDENVWIVNVGTDLESSKSAVALAEKFTEGVYATIGLHPADNQAENFDEEKFSDLIGSKVVAVGECGLDYFHEKDLSGQRRQKEEFVKQISFAQKFGLPLVIHCRDAYADLLEIMESDYTGEAIIHSFTDTWETAKKFLDRGYYIALNGILLFDKTGKLAEVAEKLPSDRILTETDAPYLTPPPNRGKRNEPVNVKYVVQRIAELRRVSTGEMSEQSFKNACTLYKINPRIVL